ncbi:MAG: cache domain-containing protein, partial [Chloroflexota bacterium]|nr:cache domain-containing protein [Chloroflexota bacterium]
MALVARAEPEPTTSVQPSDPPRAAPRRRSVVPAIPTLRIGVLQWVVGAFCGLVGALTFVTPHQFVGPAYALLGPWLGWWGALCLAGAVALYAVALLVPRRAIVVAAHLVAAAPLLLLGVSAALAGGWTGLTIYSVLAIGTAVAPLFATGRPVPLDRRDLFSILVAIGAILNGTVILLAPGLHSSVIFDPVRPYLMLYGAAFLLGGLGVVWTQVKITSPVALLWASHLLLGAGLFAFGPPVSLPNRAFTSIAYYNGFGALIAALPWLRPRLRRSEPRTLRTALALAFGLAVSAPLVVTVALVTDHVDRAARAETLSRQEVLAEALARGVADYVGLHRAATAALASQPGLLSRAPSEQVAVLRAFNGTYPDAFAFSLYDVEGRLLAYSDERGGPLANRPGLFDEVRQTERSALRIVRPPADWPDEWGLVFAIGEPIRDEAGRFAGMAAVLLESARLADVLGRARGGPGSQVFLVDADGRLITDGDPGRQAPRTNLSALVPVARLLGDDEIGALTYGPANAERLAGFARVPDLGWGVVVEHPTAAALAGPRNARDLAFAVLMVMISVAVAGGALAAGLLAAPLHGL